MNFELITLAGNKVNEKVYEVILPTVDGEISVFPDHEPLVSVAATGVIVVRRDKNHSDEQLEYFAITGGIIEIANNHVRVLVDEAEHGADIMAGSLIKNAGGGIAPTGGYVVGREDLVERVAYELTARRRS